MLSIIQTDRKDAPAFVFVIMERSGRRSSRGVRFRQGQVFNPAGFVIRVAGLCRLNLKWPGWRWRG
jgi:hypothetical protein